MSAVATVGLKATCLDLELDQNYATCWSSGGQCVCSVVSTSNYVFAKTALGYLEMF